MMQGRFLAVAVAALALSGCGKAFYEYGQDALRKDPAIRAEAMRDCLEDTTRKSQAERQILASVMKVSLARVPQVFCQRVVGAVASGRITYADLKDPQGNTMLLVLTGR